jgi:hypothetical protein
MSLIWEKRRAESVILFFTTNLARIPIRNPNADMDPGGTLNTDRILNTVQNLLNISQSLQLRTVDKNLQLPVGSEERKIRGEPFLILLDSMGGNKENAVTTIRQYLAAEWQVSNS